MVLLRVRTEGVLRVYRAGLLHTYTEWIEEHCIHLK